MKTIHPSAFNLHPFEKAPSGGQALGLRIPVGLGFDSPTGYSRQNEQHQLPMDEMHGRVHSFLSSLGIGIWAF
jgi:hypothetical protein